MPSSLNAITKHGSLFRPLPDTISRFCRRAFHTQSCPGKRPNLPNANFKCAPLEFNKIIILVQKDKSLLPVPCKFNTTLLLDSLPEGQDQLLTTGTTNTSGDGPNEESCAHHEEVCQIFQAPLAVLQCPKRYHFIYTLDESSSIQQHPQGSVPPNPVPFPSHGQQTMRWWHLPTATSWYSR